MKKDRIYWLSVLLVMLAAASYGFLTPLVKQVFGQGYTFSQVVVHQLGAGAALLWIVAALRRLGGAAGQRRSARSVPSLRSLGKLALVGTVGLAMTTILYNSALKGLSASLGIILLFQFTWITIALDSWWKRIFPGWARLGCILLILGGDVSRRGAWA